jgi:hypothetical protein
MGQCSAAVQGSGYGLAVSAAPGLQGRFAPRYFRLDPFEE